MPTDEELEQEKKKRRTIAEAYADMEARIEKLEQENERLRNDVTTVGTVDGSDGDGRESGHSGNRVVEDPAEQSTAAEDSKASEQDGSEGNESLDTITGDDGQELLTGEPHSDEPPRATHLWWRNPWGGR